MPGGFKVQKSERLLIREAWEKADAYRPGRANWFTKQQQDLVGLHESLGGKIDALEELPPASNVTSLLGALLKVLGTGDLALTLCSPEPPVLTQLRDWLVSDLPMEEAVRGLPEEQGRILGTLVRAMDARRILDLGTFTGYSSIAMALAAAEDARVVCCEPQAQYARMARDWWMKAGCQAKLEMHEVGAEELMASRLEAGEAGTYDFVFCDVGDRARYQACHEQIMQLLRVGGYVVYYGTLWAADEVLQHDAFPAMRQFNADLARDPRVVAMMVPLSYGITLCVKTVELDGGAYADAKGAGDDAVAKLLLERRAAVEQELAAMESVRST